MRGLAPSPAAPAIRARRSRARAAAAALLATLFLAAATAPLSTAAPAPDAAALPPPPKPQQKDAAAFSFTLPPALPRTRPVRKVALDVRLAARAVDGVPRPVVLVNGRFQPTVTVAQGDALELALLNNLPASWPQAGGGISVHQHGFALADGQAGWHDGTAQVAQCRVPPGGRRVARFVVRERPGTYFWHDHTSLVRGDGLMGALVVEPPPWAPKAPLAMLPGAGFGAGDDRLFPRARGVGFYDAPPEHVVFLSDWWHLPQDAMALRFNRPLDPAKQTESAGKWHWVGLPKAVLINGKGSYAACEDVTTRALGRRMRSGAPAVADDLLLPDGLAGQLKGTAAFPTCNVTGMMTPAEEAEQNNNSAAAAEGSIPGRGAPAVLDVAAGRTALLRVINAANLVYMTFCVRGHWLRVIAADSSPVAPLDAFECVDVNGGQRLDVLLVANATGASPGSVFWVSASSQYRKGAPTGYAVLRYVEDDGGKKKARPLLAALPPGDQMLQPQESVGRIRALDTALRMHPLLLLREIPSDAGGAGAGAGARLSRAERSALERAVQANRAAGNRAPKWDSAEARRYGPPQQAVGPEEFSAPKSVTRRYVIRLTQPLFEANGFVRWALNNVAMAAKPSCPPMLRALYEARAAGGPEYPALFEKNRMAVLPRGEVDALAGGGVYFAGALNASTTVGPSDPAGLAIFDGGPDDEVLVRAQTPRAGKHVISIPLGEDVEIVFQNQRAGADGGEYGDPSATPLVSNRTGLEQHPMHLHGYAFSVVGMGAGRWSLADVAAYNLEDPPLRDTVSVLAPAAGAPAVGGWSAVRLRTSNTGVWPLHCHQSFHQQLGMMTTLVVGDVGPGGMSPPPAETAGEKGQCSGECHYQFAASPPKVGLAMFGDRMAPDSNVGFVTVPPPP